MFKCLSILVLASGLWLTASVTAVTQPPAQSWAVYKVPPLGFVDPDGKVVATAGSEEEAKRIAKQLQDQEYKTGRFPHPSFIASKVESADANKDKPNVTNDAGPDAKKLLAAVVEAKQAVDQAKKVSKGEEPLLKAAERKLGDALKEYKDAVAGAYQRAVEAKKTLTEGVGGLTDAKFKTATAAVERYNGMVRDYEAKSGGGLGYTVMSAPTSPRRMLSLAMPGGNQLAVPLSDVDPKVTAVGEKSNVDLAGRSASGTIGDRKVTFEFQPSGKLAISGATTGAGKWGVDGNRVTMTTDVSVFLGTVNKDGKMAGKHVKRDGTGIVEWVASVRPNLDSGLAELLSSRKWFVAMSYGDSIQGTGTIYSFDKDGGFTEVLTRIDRSSNTAKGRWEIVDGRLMIEITDRGLDHQNFVSLGKSYYADFRVRFAVTRNGTLVNAELAKLLEAGPDNIENVMISYRATFQKDGKWVLHNTDGRYVLDSNVASWRRR